MDLKTPYLTQQIIAYIGNKRRLLGLLYKAFQASVPNMQSGLRFLDVFAGSGVVSRLAKQMNWEVFSNDWEAYAYVLNSGFVQLSVEDIPRLFDSYEVFEQELAHINELPLPDAKEQYIAKYYAPASFDIQEADYKTERLFYTRQNALAIDKIRNYIDMTYSAPQHTEKRTLLLALLLYEAATHTNTSGVFKAFHKGFGGHSGDALKRILSPITMTPPVLMNSQFPVHVFCEDANTLIRKKDVQSLDIAYLDPPYNQHQYGSNYHLLNTIALWDKPEKSLALNEKGVLREKAAIRSDWKKTKSDYCYKDKAIASFQDLLDNLDAKHIFISYSNDGIIPFELMKDMCAQKGRISLVTNEYTKYRGGRQSNSRLNSNIEFVLCLDTRSFSQKMDFAAIDVLIQKKELLVLLKQRFVKSRLKEICKDITDTTAVFDLRSKDFVGAFENYIEIKPVDDLEKLTVSEIETLTQQLKYCVCVSKEEELSELLGILSAGLPAGKKLVKSIPATLKKLAHKKTKEQYFYWFEEVKKLETTAPQYFSQIHEALCELAALAEKRFQ